MRTPIADWCGMPKNKHSVSGWIYCQSKISQRRSSREPPGGVG